MKTLPLTNSKLTTIVDDDIWERFSGYSIWLRQAGKSQYAQICLANSVTIGLHALILIVEYPFEVDHKDGNGLNNQRENLRAATHQQNHQNQGKQIGIYTSAHVGVSYFKRDNCWRSYINLNGKQKHLGYFKTERRAAIEYNKAAQHYFGEFAKLNTIEVVQ